MLSWVNIFWDRSVGKALRGSVDDAALRGGLLVLLAICKARAGRAAVGLGVGDCGRDGGSD